MMVIARPPAAPLTLSLALLLATLPRDVALGEEAESKVKGAGAETATPGEAAIPGESTRSGGIEQTGAVAAGTPGAGGVAADCEVHRFEPCDERRRRSVPVKVYAPRVTAAGKRPVVLFSHGLGGSREGCGYLGECWAGAGYVAVFLQHPGSDENVWRGVPLLRRVEAIREAGGASQLLDRIGDVSFALDQLDRWNRQAGHPLAGRCDLEHVGMAGHSFGGGTTQAVMGRRFPGDRHWIEPRLDAFLVLSPNASRGRAPEEEFGTIRAPVLCMTGTRDESPLGDWPTPESRQSVYRGLPEGDKYQLVFDGANHFSFTEKGEGTRFHAPIARLSTEFWDAYLQKDGTARGWLASGTPRTELPLHEADVWEWK